MALIDDIKVSLRVVSPKFDSEVQMLIDGALYDMGRVGVNPDLLALDDEGNLANAYVKHAVTAYCKSHFGYDVEEATRFSDAYNRIVIDLLNSAQNIAAIEAAGEVGEGGETGDGLGSEQLVGEPVGPDDNDGQ